MCGRAAARDCKREGRERVQPNAGRIREELETSQIREKAWVTREARGKKEQTRKDAKSTTEETQERTKEIARTPKRSRMGNPEERSQGGRHPP